MWRQEVSTELGAIKNWAHNKLGLTPVEISNLLGVAIQEHSTVEMIIFPRLSIGAGKLRIEVAGDRFAH